MHTLHYS